MKFEEDSWQEYEKTEDAYVPSPYISMAASSLNPTVPSSRGVNTVVATFWK